MICFAGPAMSPGYRSVMPWTNVSPMRTTLPSSTTCSARTCPSSLSIHSWRSNPPSHPLAQCYAGTMLRDPGWLLWLLVVVLPCAVIGALVGPNCYRATFDGPRQKANAQMADIGQAVGLYTMMNKKLPGSLQDLMRTHAQNPHPFIDSIPDDPWGNPYELWPLPDNEFRIRCSGEDGKPFTEDDIWWPESVRP